MELNITTADKLKEVKVHLKNDMKQKFVEALEVGIPHLVNQEKITISYEWFNLNENDVKDVYDAVKAKGYKIIRLGNQWDITL